MNPREAKFILRAHRHDGRYRPDDALFAEALEAAANTPELAAWLDGEQTLDAVIATKLDGIQPPADLRETILAGARASRLKRRWWQQTFWLAAAAAVVFAGTLVTVQLRGPAAYPMEHALADFALRDAADKNHHHGSSTEAAQALFAALRDDPRPLTQGAAPDFAAMRAAGCKRFTIAGREVFEVCVVRNGRWFHLYATRREDDSAAPEAHTTFTERGSVIVATWSTATTTYALASSYGRDTLTGLI